MDVAVKGTLFKWSDGTNEYVALTYFSGPVCDACQRVITFYVLRAEDTGWAKPNERFGSYYDHLHAASQVREACVSYGHCERAYEWQHGTVPVSLAKVL